MSCDMYKVSTYHSMWYVMLKMENQKVCDAENGK